MKEKRSHFDLCVVGKKIDRRTKEQQREAWRRKRMRRHNEERLWPGKRRATLSCCGREKREESRELECET